MGYTIPEDHHESTPASIRDNRESTAKVESTRKHMPCAVIIRCVKVTRPETHGAQNCIYSLDKFSAFDEFDGADPGEKIQLELLELPEDVFQALPDFTGW